MISALRPRKESMYISIQSLLSALSAFIAFYHLILICELPFLWTGILTRSVHIRKHHRLKVTVPPTWGMLIVLLSLLNSRTIFIYKLIIYFFVCCCCCVFSNDEWTYCLLKELVICCGPTWANVLIILNSTAVNLHLSTVFF